MKERIYSGTRQQNGTTSVNVNGRPLDAGVESRFIFLTGDTLAPEARGFLERSGRPHLAKPFDLAEVEAAVAQALR